MTDKETADRIDDISETVDRITHISSTVLEDLKKIKRMVHELAKKVNVE